MTNASPHLATTHQTPTGIKVLNNMNVRQFVADKFLMPHGHLKVVLCRTQSTDLRVATIVSTTSTLVGYQPARAHNLHAVPHFERKLPQTRHISLGGVQVFRFAMKGPT